MARYPNYPKAPFSASQNFLARDPAGSGQVIRVQGQSILDAAVQEILDRGDIVQAVDTLTEAKANDYESGIYVLTGGNTVTLDGGQAIYRVSDPGSGGIVMDNGNELVLLFVANTPANIITPFDSIADLPEVNADYRVSVTGYHPSTTVGGGEFVGNASARHDGVIYFDPDRSAEIGTAAYYVDSGVDVPCWERVSADEMYTLPIESAGGGVSQGGDVNLAAIEAISALGLNIELLSSVGAYDFSSVPSLASDITTDVFSESSITGVTLEDIKGIIKKSGTVLGFPFAPDARNKQIEIVAGVIRKQAIGSAAWFFINDTEHRPIGVADPSAIMNAVGGDVTIDFGKTYSKVISFLCGPDETLATKLNASVGASVGLSNATISMGVHVEASGAVRNNGSVISDINLSEFDVNASTAYNGAGTATVSFDAIGSSFVETTLWPWSDSGAYAPYLPVIKSYGGDEITVNFVNSLGSTLYTGALTPELGFGWSIKRNGTALLDGTEATAIENVLAGGSSNIWFFGIFEV